MSFDAIETSAYGAKGFDLYLFDTGSTIYTLTNEDAPIAFNGRTYLPATITRDEIELSPEQNAGQVKVKLPKSHPLAALFIPNLPPVPVSLTIYSGHHGDDEIVAIFVGRVASARYPDMCELACITDRDDLKRKIPTLLYQGSCPRIFGDPGCAIDLANYTYNGTLQSASADGTILTVPAFASTPHSLIAGFIRRGNDVRLVIAQNGAQITVMNAIPGLRQDDTIVGTAGCTKTYADCAAFSNVANFLGFDMIPSRNPFQGRIV